MTSSERCQICERRPTAHACDRCGTLVCATHFAAELGFCTECAERTPAEARDDATFQISDVTDAE